MDNIPPPQTPPSHHPHHHDTYSHRNWFVSDKRHKRFFAAVFYTFLVPILLLFAIFLILNSYLGIYLFVCQMRWALGYWHTNETKTGRPDWLGLVASVLFKIRIADAKCQPLDPPGEELKNNCWSQPQVLGSNVLSSKIWSVCTLIRWQFSACLNWQLSIRFG